VATIRTVLEGGTILRADLGENTAAALASAASAAADAAAAAISAGLAEALGGNLYGSTAAGLADTTDGDEFTVDNSDGTATIYLNDGGSAVERRTIIIDPSATGSAAHLGTATGQTVQAAIDGVPTRAGLKALVAAAGRRAHLAEGGRAGNFVCRSGSTPTDPLEGIYIASNTSGFYWEREWDGINAKPEWFGAVINSNASGAGAANKAAIEAVIDLCPVVRFARADYWINAKVIADVPYVTVLGHRGDGYNTGTGTRIISTNTSEGVWQFGPTTKPADLPNFMRGIFCDGITFQHSAIPGAPTSGNEATAVPTVEVRYVQRAEIIWCNAWEPLIGFKFTGALQTYIRDCKILRTSTAPSGSDFCWAFYADGGAPFTGIPGNPSIYIDHCAVQFSSGLSVPKVAYQFTGDFSDVFVHRCECSAATNAFALSGSGTKAQINMHLNGCVADQCSATALDIQGLAAGACVNVEGGYWQANDTALAVMHLRGGNGTVNITGGCQIVGGQAGDMIGVYGQGQQQINIGAGVCILETPRPIVLEGVTGAQLLCSVQNDSVGDGTRSMLDTTASDGVSIAVQVRGKTGAFARGVGLVGTANSRVSIDPTLIDRNVISGGASNLVVADSFGTPAAITAPGYYTGAGASGTSGAGIYVTGITA